MFDRQAFEDLTAGDAEVARELTDLFREDIAELLEQLGDAVANQRDEEVRRIGHTMKSSCASMGATEASKLGARIEAEGTATAETVADALRAAVETALEGMEACCSAVGC